MQVFLIASLLSCLLAAPLRSPIAAWKSMTPKEKAIKGLVGTTVVGGTVGLSIWAAKSLDRNNNAPNTE